MKKIVLMVALGLFFSVDSLAQLNADQLIRVNNVANTDNMNAINSPNEGSLVYVESDDNLYIRKGNNWSTIWTNQGNSATDSCFIGPISNHDFKIRTNNAQRMVVKKDGNIGINTSDPDFLFQVNAGFVTSSTSINNATPSTNSGWGVDNIIDGNSGSYWQSATQWIGGSNYSNWIKLDLGTPKVISRYRLETPSANPTDWYFQGSNDNSSWTNLHYVNGPSLGAWTTQDYTLSTQTTAYRYYRLFMTATLWYYSGYYTANTGYMRIGEFRLFEATTDSTINGDFIVKSNGNVGVGINPTQKLHVNGDTRVEGNIVATGTITPDYVFENYFEGKSEINPEYEFTPIEKAERFVKENKHLPGVPSAADIEEQGGIIVNRATEINLEKIEELYLYIFELNAQMKELKEELNKCKSSN